MRVSVVLPVWNEAGRLNDALDSLDRQTESHFETIAVDDGSTDGTWDLLQERAGQNPRLRPVRQAHGGIVTVLNHGLSLARGRYVARMDADDTCASERLRLQADFLDSRPEIGLVASRVRFTGDPHRHAGMHRWVRWTNGLLDPETIAQERFVESPFVHPSVMFRRELVERCGGYRDGDFPEDYELWLRWQAAGVRMEKLSEELVEWRERPDRLTRTDSRYSQEAFFRAKAPYLARWLNENNPFHPQIVVWGAGRVTRRRLRPLLEQGIRVAAFVDVDPGKVGSRVAGAPVLGPAEIPGPGEAFVLVAVGKLGARELIEPHLRRRGFEVGRSCLFCA